jgi:metal-responsive CopG/Arc/MetJ family transcriptional regulator
MPAESTDVKRIDITLPSDLHDRLTALAEYRGLSRTELIRLILTAHVNAQRETTSPSSQRPPADQ